MRTDQVKPNADMRQFRTNITERRLIVTSRTRLYQIDGVHILVTRLTLVHGGVRSIEAQIHMTRCAGDGLVCAKQLKPGVRRMVELHLIPNGRPRSIRVAGGAWEIGRDLPMRRH